MDYVAFTAVYPTFPEENIRQDRLHCHVRTELYDSTPNMFIRLWEHAIVENCLTGSDGLVRKVNLRLSGQRKLTRPIHKLCLIATAGLNLKIQYQLFMLNYMIVLYIIAQA